VKIATLPADIHAASPGWGSSSVLLLPHQAGQGTFVPGTLRVKPTELATGVAFGQLRAGSLPSSLGTASKSATACLWKTGCSAQRLLDRPLRVIKRFSQGVFSGLLSISLASGNTAGASYGGAFSSRNTFQRIPRFPAS